MSEHVFTARDHAAPPPTLRSLVPSSGIYLTTRGHGDEDRFCRVFRQSWRRVPYVVRRRLVAYWRADHPFKWRNLARVTPAGSPPLRPTSPRVELLWGWVGARMDAVVRPPLRRPDRPAKSPKGHDPDGDAVAMCMAHGHVLRFRAGAVDFMPDDVLADLIAHELAHVDQAALGDTFAPVPPGTPSYLDDCETDANVRAESWGFDIGSVGVWLESVGLATVFNL